MICFGNIKIAAPLFVGKCLGYNWPINYREKERERDRETHGD